MAGVGGDGRVGAQERLERHVIAVLAAVALQGRALRLGAAAEVVCGGNITPVREEERKLYENCLYFAGRQSELDVKSALNA